MPPHEPIKPPAAASQPSRGNHAASRVIFIRVPGELWPELLASSATPSTLSRLIYALGKLVCVLSILESLSHGRSIAAGTRRAGVGQVTGWRWYNAFLNHGVAGLVPLTHTAGRKAKSPVHRDRAIRLPVHVALGDLRLHGGRVALAASAPPPLCPLLPH